MYSKWRCFLPALLLLSFTASGQGTRIFLYDQQSADESQSSEVLGIIQSTQPVGQSFTPSLSAVGFVRLQLYDIAPGNGLGARLYVNLRANSINGSILGSTETVFPPDGFFGGFTNFQFAREVPVTSGVTYYFQPVVKSGDQWGIGASPLFNYPGGTIIVEGAANPASDLWFREGIIIPEPSGVWLALVGGGMFVWHRRMGKASARPPPRIP